MADVLKDVTVTFEKAFKGEDVKVVKEGEKNGRPWKIYAFNVSFKDETGQVKKHKTKSFAVPGPLGTSMVGDIELYHGNGQNGPYVSYTFTPKPGREPQKAAPRQQEATKVPVEVRELAVSKLLRKGFDVTKALVGSIVDDTEDDKKKGAQQLLTDAFTEIWKCAVMSLKIDGNMWPDLLESARQEFAEAAGMPTDEEIEASEPKEEDIGVVLDENSCPF